MFLGSNSRFFYKRKTCREKEYSAEKRPFFGDFSAIKLEKNTCTFSVSRLSAVFHGVSFDIKGQLFDSIFWDSTLLLPPPKKKKIYILKSKTGDKSSASLITT